MPDETLTGPGAQPAATPTAPVDTSALLKSLTAEQYATWERTGDLPSTDAAAESSPAPSGTQSASTDAKTPAASEPANPDSKPSKVKARSQQLDSEIAELNEKLRIRHTLREELARTTPPKPDAPPAPSAAETRQQDLARLSQHPDAPKLDDFAVYEDYVAAMAVFVADQRLSARDRTQQAARSRQSRLHEVDRIATTARQRMDTARQADPEFDAKVNPALLELTPAFVVPSDEPIHPWHSLIAEVMQSEAQAALLVHFSTPEGQKEWAELCGVGARNPPEMLRRFGRVEARFESRAESAGEKTPPVKTVTSAPVPPTTLGRQAAAPADDVESAVAAGDFAAYEARMNARDGIRTSW